MKKTIFMITLALACMFAQAQVIDPLLQTERSPDNLKLPGLLCTKAIRRITH